MIVAYEGPEATLANETSPRKLSPMKYRLPITALLTFVVTACGDDETSTPTTPVEAGVSATTTASGRPSASNSGTTSPSATTNPSGGGSSTLDASAPDASPPDADLPFDGGAFVLSSPAFVNGGALPQENTCEGKDFGAGISPELNWTGAPLSTVVYALVFKDTTLVMANDVRGYHWAAWNIPVEVTGIPRDLTAGDTPAELLGGSQFRAGPPVEQPSFFGPCPSWNTFCSDAPRSNDSYAFALYAFDSELTVPLPEDGRNYVDQLDEFFLANAVASSVLTATSDAAPISFPSCPVLPPDGGMDGGPDAGPMTDSGMMMDSGMDASPMTDSGSFGFDASFSFDASITLP
jgi:phosphatidylethanolamine-binding protein (PEBP) family uncharacterized protein